MQSLLVSFGMNLFKSRYEPLQGPVPGRCPVVGNLCTTGLYPKSYLAFGAVGHDDIDKHEHKAVVKFLHRLDGTLLQALLYRVDIARPKNDFVDHTIVDNQFSERLVICHLR